MMVHLNCQLDENNLGDRPLGMHMRGCPYQVKDGGKTYQLRAAPLPELGA